MSPTIERIFSSPWAFVSGCLVWIPVAFWVISLVHWMVQGEVEAGWGIVGIFVAMLLGFTTMLPPRPELGPFLFAGVVISSVLFPAFRNTLRKRALDAVDFEAAENAYEMLRIKPDNYVIRLKFAKMLYKRGLRGSAMILAEQSLPHLPQAGFFEEHRMFEGWKRSLQYGAPPEQYVVCLECGHRNPPATFVCESCQAEFLIDHLRGRWIGRNLGRKLLAAWASIMLALIGIPMAAVMLPRTMSAGVIILLVVASVGIAAFGLIGGKDAR